MRTIEKNGKTIAIVFDGTFEDGTKPVTEEFLPLQIVALKHKKGKKFVPHTHGPKKRTTEKLAEALMIFSGVVKVSVFDEINLPIEDIVLKEGEGVMIVNGGIGIEILEDAEMMEFKNGPFVEDKIVIG